MGEPEDLIIDGAYLASRLARDVWRRYAPPSAENVLRLSGIRLRLELFLHALFAMPIGITAANAPAPVSWLARLAGRSGAGPDGFAGTDGACIYLPAALDATSGMDVAFEDYLLSAVQQSVRLVRRSATLALGISNREVHDRFLLAEAIAVDAWIAGVAPGLVPALRAARREALAHRSRTWPRSFRIAVRLERSDALPYDLAGSFGDLLHTCDGDAIGALPGKGENGVRIAERIQRFAHDEQCILLHVDDPLVPRDPAVG